MKNSRKVLSLILALILTCSLLLAGCAKTANTTEAGDKTTTAAGTTAPAATTAAEQKLDFKALNLYWPSDARQPSHDQVNEAINKYLADAGLNCTLQLNPVQWGEWDQRIPVMLSSSEQMDLLWTAAWKNYNQDAAKDAFVALDDLLKEFGQGILEKTYPEYLDAAKVNGKIYAIPVNKDMGQGGGLVAEKAVLDKYGVNPSDIKTMEDIEAIILKVKADGTYPQAFYLEGNNVQIETGLVPNRSMLDSYGKYEVLSSYVYLVFDNQEKTFKLKYDQKEWIDNVTVLNKWFKNGLINQDADITQSSGWEMFREGKQTWGFITSTQPGQEGFYESASGADLTVIEMGKGTATTGTLCGSVTAIPTSTIDAERAMMVLNLAYSDPEFINLFINGIPGVHYEKVSDTVIKLPNGVASREAGGWNPAMHWQFGNIFLNYTWQETETADKFTILDQYNKSLLKSQLLGFAFDNSKIQQVDAALNTVYQEYRPILLSGASDDINKTLSEFTKKLKDNGVDQLIAELQSQYNAWAK